MLGFALEGLTGPIWVRWGLHATALEYVGDALAVAGYWLLWLLLPISALRPERDFSVRGDCKLRAKRFGLVLGLLVLVHAAIVLTLALAWRGGWR